MIVEPSLRPETASHGGKPAAQRAYRELERLIVTLELPPGGATTEGALIDRLGFGRTPVREAVQRLAWEGLIEVRPRAGIVVAPIRAEDWLRVIDARRGVEEVLARGAARFATEAEADDLHEAAIAMRNSVISGSVEIFLAADKALDEALGRAGDNLFAARLAAPLQTHSRRFWYRYQRGSGLARAAEQHLELILAVLQRGEDEAGRASGRLMDMLRDLALAASRR